MSIKRIRKNKKKILSASIALTLLALLFVAPVFIADPDNVISFLPENQSVTIDDSFVMNINVTLDQQIDTCAVDNMTFNGSIITTESSNITKGNRFTEGELDDIITVDNTNGWIASIVWGSNNTENSGTKNFANITWYAAGCGETEVQMTAGGTAYNGSANATINHSCNITVHPKQPINFESQVNSSTLIFLNWTKQLGGDNVTIFAKQDSAPTGYDDGTAANIYNGTGVNYEHTVGASEHWYYLAYSWNTSASLYSLTNISEDNTSTSGLSIADEFPVNSSTAVLTPPANLSAYVSGTNIDAYIYFVNMTPESTTPWTLVNSWSGIDSQRIEQASLYNFGRATEFIWGNTTYTWSVNITDGSSWLNETYTYTTEELIDGANARYNVDNDTTVFVGDLNTVWAGRSGQAPWDSLLNVDGDGTIFVGDLNTIWAGRS